MKTCNSCGKCCIKYSNGSLSASDADLDVWERLRPDIFQYVRDGKIWMDPKTGQQIELCPWLRKEPNGFKFTCTIYFDRPEDCRVYPARVSDMVNDECEMLEPKDFSDLLRAQDTLDTKYRDS